MKRNNIWKMSAFTLLCGALAACGTNGGTGAATSEDAGSSGAPGGKTEVSMTVMTSTRFLEQAEEQFEAAHPDIDIVIEEISPAENTGKQIIISKPGQQEIGPPTEDVDKYINSVNTALMSGNASDILSVELLSYERYAEEGLLADWNEFASKDETFDKSDYFVNIFDGIADEGGWYGIPTSFTLDALVGDASLLQQNGLEDATWTWDQFVELVEKLGQDGSGKYGLSMMKPEELLTNLAETVYEQLVKQDGGDASFDAAALQAYMEKVKRLYDDGLLTAESTGPDSTHFIYMNMETPIQVAMIPKMRTPGGTAHSLLRLPGTGTDEGVPFSSDQVLALNAKSESKEAAWEFVKFLLSPEMQSSPASMQFPVHQDAMKESLKRMQEMLANGGNGGEMSLSVRGPNGASIELTDKDIESILAVVPSIGKYQSGDAKVLNMIREESKAYFSGSKSAGAVAELLANRITTYLNE